MSDTVSPAKRSYIMSCVPSKNTKPELVVRSFLHERGFRYRLHVKNLPGSPDIVLRKYKTVIFINGCFWHGHLGCTKSALPKTNTEYWHNKISRNIKNDILTEQALRDKKWRVLVIWECELHRNYRLNSLMALQANLQGR